jgi:uncharacterized protein involved in exopolysaccharide biosynthesis
MDSLALVLRRRRLLIGSAVAGLVIGLLIALLSPAHYTTTFSFIPQTESDPGRSGLASLAGQFGVSLGSISGQASSPQLYADLLTSREILAPVALDSATVEGRRVPIYSILRVKEDRPAERTIETIKRLRDEVISTSVATRTTGVVSVEVRTRSAAGSYAIAQGLLAGLTQFNVQTRQSQAGAERRFIEGRLAQAKQELSAREGRLSGFLESNRVVTNSPALQFQLERLRRDVTTMESLVESLTQQYEEARIREVRDTPVITLIDRPVAAVRSDPRGRLRILLGSISAAFILTFAAIFATDRIQREFAEYEITSLASLTERSALKSRRPA